MNVHTFIYITFTVTQQVNIWREQSGRIMTRNESLLFTTKIRTDGK